MSWKSVVDDYKTQRMMDKYGVSWFKFDEPNGDATDSKGATVGTVNGATRVTGWNEEGSALSFNGVNNYVLFNDKVIPIGEKSIRFKFKTNADGAIISNNVGSGQHGDYIMVDGDKLEWRSHKGTVGSQRFLLVSKKIVNDNQWHDVLLTWDGTLNVNSVKMYIDDMKNPEAIGTANSLESSQTANLNLGSAFSGTSRNNYFNGRLDNLEIYNKVLTPEYLKLQKTLIQSDSSYLYLNSSNQWQTLSTNSPIFQDYLDYGMDYTSPLLDRVNGYSLVDELPNNFKLKTFTDNPNAKVLLVSPVPAQIAYPNGDISLFGVETIDGIELFATGNAKVAISFDKGDTWNAYRNGEWVTVTNAHDGMTTSELNSLTAEQMDLGRDSSDTIRFSYSLTEGVEIDQIKLRVSMRGWEKIADYTDHQLTYDTINKELVFNITKSGTYSVNYIDGQ